MKKLMFVLAALLLCGAAFANDPFSSKETSKFGVGLMILNPTDSLTKQSGSSWLGFDISYHLKCDSADRPTRSINLGYIGGDKDRDLTGIDAKASFMPITYSFTKYSKDSGNGFYYGAEAGFAYAKMKAKPALGGSWRSDSGFVPILAATVGYNFSTYYYAAFKYYFPFSGLNLPVYGDADFDGWCITLGTNYTF